MINVKVKYKGGSEQATALPQELIESGDIIGLPSGQVLKLVGTDAHGTKKYEEIDPPSKEEAKAETVTADGETAGAAFRYLSKGLTFPEPGPSKPLVGDDGQPLPPPSGKAREPAPTPQA